MGRFSAAVRQPSLLAAPRSIALVGIAGRAARGASRTATQPDRARVAKSDAAREALERASRSRIDPLLEATRRICSTRSSRRDPFEGFNRDIFSFNRSVDRWMFDPITRGYQFAVPAPGRRALYRVFQNLDSPVILANHMLQFRVVDAAGTTTRFVINSSLGRGRPVRSRGRLVRGVPARGRFRADARALRVAERAVPDAAVLRPEHGARRVRRRGRHPRRPARLPARPDHAGGRSCSAGARGSPRARPISTISRRSRRARSTSTPRCAAPISRTATRWCARRAASRRRRATSR